MAKTVKKTIAKKTPDTAKPKSVPAPSSLVLKLGAPGMTPMHRAGLGGLAATLVTLERLGKKKKDFNWNITPTEITLDFGTPENAGACLDWLFSLAFQIDKNGLIYLPGQYGLQVPPVEIRARLQQGITLTFLQHGQTRKLGDKQTASYVFDNKKIEYIFQPCFRYTHQTSWKKWINRKGELKAKNYDVIGAVNPGVVVRHEQFEKASTISQPIELVLPLQFALVGTLSFSIKRGEGVLVVPYIDDIQEFADCRAELTPTTVAETYVGGTGDAMFRLEIKRHLSPKKSRSVSVKPDKALQFEIKRRGSQSIIEATCLGGMAITFRAMPWAKQQKYISSILSVESLDLELLNAYDIVFSHLCPHVVSKSVQIKTGKGKNATTTEKIESFWVDSVVRPFIANNLAQEKYWFADFTRMMKSTDPASEKSLWNKIKFEKKGLNDMVNDDKLDWKLDGARSLVLAVQEALRRQYRNIKVVKTATKEENNNRCRKEYDKWRLAFSDAKTPEQFRYSLSDMFSRAKIVPELELNWDKITKLLLDDWQLARDLALIGLVSYKKKKKKNTSQNDKSALDKDNSNN